MHTLLWRTTIFAVRKVNFESFSFYAHLLSFISQLSFLWFRALSITEGTLTVFSIHTLTVLNHNSVYRYQKSTQPLINGNGSIHDEEKSQRNLHICILLILYCTHGMSM